MRSSSEYVEKLNQVLSDKKNADVCIMNDKLTLSVFSILEKSLKNVRRIYLIIRTDPHLPKDEVSREFEMNPNDTLYNEYDIIEKNELTHFAKAKAMHDFIKKNVEIRRLDPRAKAGINILIIDDDFMITGTASLELSERDSERNVNFNAVIDGTLDKAQIVAAKNEFERVWLSDRLTFDFKDELLKSLAFVYKEQTPEFAYYFTLNELFGNKIDEGVQRFERDNAGFKESIIWNMLYDFQKEAVLYAIQKLNKYNGCIIADSVGLGKTFEALAVIKYFSDRQDNILVLTPAKLYNNWDSYRENVYSDNPLADDNIRYKVLCHTDLSRYSGKSRSGYDLERFDWSRFDLIVIDESHNFRNRTEKEEDEGETRYQRLLETVIKKKNRTKVLLLSATPVNNGLSDLKHQIDLITADNDSAYLKDGIESYSQTLRQASSVFNNWEKNGRKGKEQLYDMLPKDFFALLELLTISRSRKHITNYYKSSDIGSFPLKLPVKTYYPEIDTDKKLLIFKETLTILEDLLLAAYTPMRYIKKEYRRMYIEKYQTIHKGRVIFNQEQRENTTKILQMFNLFKRLESSVYAFEQTLRKQHDRINRYIELLEKHSGDISDEAYYDDEETALEYKLDIKVAHIDTEKYLDDLYFDRHITERLLEQARTILDNGRDSKLIELRGIVRDKIENTPYNPGNRKILIFSAFADTANYLYDSMAEKLLKNGYYCAMVSGADKPKTTLPPEKEIRKGYDFNKILTCFSPRSKHADIPADRQITVLIGTDCISEGQNLQDCDTVINYDIQWNPVALIQRFGRIDRIGSTNARIKLINFFPAVDLNEYLRLESRVKNKMIQSNIVSTGDDNLLDPEMNDISFRTKQMEKLKDEVIDIDDAADTISITDLNMNQYVHELSQYRKAHPELLRVPRGIYSIAKASETGLDRDGVLFCFKYKNNEEKPNSDSSLFPYYIAFIADDEEIVFGSTQARELLKRLRGLCHGRNEVNTELVNEFLKETKQTKDMKKYSHLLSKAVNSIQKVEEDSAGFTLFDFGGFRNDFANKTSDDFELVSFIIVRRED